MKRVLFLVLLPVLSSAACDSGPSTSYPAPFDAGGLDAPIAEVTPPAADAATDGGLCSAARAQLVGAVNSVAAGAVTVVSTTAGVTTLYVDATAGGAASAVTNPWLFVDLGTGAKVPVTDTTSVSSTAWDLAFKRPIIYTNSLDGGPGLGGAVMLAKEFAAVTAADATGVTFGTEEFFDAECNAVTDPTGAVLTTFASWYDYDESTHMLTPAAGTWLVKGGTGALYKVRIVTYYGNPDGTAGATGGAYLLDVAAL
ncbi:MAG TPA: HmuY family protein [Polyangia bacterium]